MASFWHLSQVIKSEPLPSLTAHRPPVISPNQSGGYASHYISSLSQWSSLLACSAISLACIRLTFCLAHSTTYIVHPFDLCLPLSAISRAFAFVK